MTGRAEQTDQIPGGSDKVEEHEDEGLDRDDEDELSPGGA